jgi:two-component system, OmpR family, phosphate regulon sensor histidine kinase PhoR
MTGKSKPFAGSMDRLGFSKILMIATIVLIAGFQAYWLNKLYEDEKQGLKKEADILFRESVYKLQLQKLKDDTLFRKLGPNNFLMKIVAASGKISPGLDSMTFTYSDSTTKDTMVHGRMMKDRIIVNRLEKRRTPMMVRTSLGESLKISEVDSSYRQELKNAKVNIGFEIGVHKINGNPKAFMDSVDEKGLKTQFEIVGLSNSLAYQANLYETTTYLLGRITYPILISVLLITLTTASFVFLYRNLLAQRRLAVIKNDFISNITHELKTPIATVNVAIEALKNFNAAENPERTKEYLEISSSELQRLSLLVDKVLKLSLFENKEIDLKKERFDLKDLTEDVIKTMQLQLQNKKATLNFNATGEIFSIEADKLHITSVIYNLLDNALKYSPDNPKISITLIEQRNSIELMVQDNGIGIPAEYKEKIFDKFFRVPHGNMHNIKGYGLGLSYVHHVIHKHNGSIEVESEEGNGCTFKVNLLKAL